MCYKSYRNGNVVTDKQTQIRDGIYCFEKYIINHMLTLSSTPLCVFSGVLLF